LLFPKIPHPGAILQWITPLERFSTIVQVAEEKRILPLGKSRIHIFRYLGGFSAHGFLLMVFYFWLRN
jgi:hypothetical protein